MILMSVMSPLPFTRLSYDTVTFTSPSMLILSPSMANLLVASTFINFNCLILTVVVYFWFVFSCPSFSTLPTNVPKVALSGSMYLGNSISN